MQLYALYDSVPIVATRATKGKSYTCPECHLPVKVRSGPWRQPHFYHARSSKKCRQSGKSEEHLALQCKLLLLIGKDAQMECPFPSLSRIADVAWHEKKIIFEIQCSPLSLEEAHARNSDYLKAGYTVIWILHDKRFNRRTLSAAENYLRSVGCYFTNINRLGSGIIYDQFEIIQTYQREFKGPKLPIVPEKFCKTPSFNLKPDSLSKLLRNRLLIWSHYWQGDLLDRLIESCSLEEKAEQYKKIEEKYIPNSSYKRLPVLTLLIRSYEACIRFFVSSLS